MKVLHTAPLLLFMACGVHGRLQSELHSEFNSDLNPQIDSKKLYFSAINNCKNENWIQITTGAKRLMKIFTFQNYRFQTIPF